MINMEVALIPPVSLLEDTDKTTMQLMLPLEELNRIDYLASYKAHLKAPGQYVILDNGAAEANQVDDEFLVYQAEKWKPNELAIPDVLGDSTKDIRYASFTLG